MGINFPDAPTAGQIFNSGTARYTYTGGIWKAAPLGTALPFNYLINSAFWTSQENGSNALSAGGTYPADQWAVFNSTGLAFTTQRVALTTPKGMPNRLRFTNTAGGALAGSSLACWQQGVEGARLSGFQWGAAVAFPVVVRFGFKGPAGTYNVALRNAATDRGYVGLFTISAGQAGQDTEQVFAIPGDVTGTWPRGQVVGMYFTVMLANGGSAVGTAGSWQAGNVITASQVGNNFATANSVFEVFDCGLYLDPNNTGRAPPWENVGEMISTMEARRYWTRVQYGIGLCASAAVFGRCGSALSHSMRPTPTQTTVGSISIGDGFSSYPLGTASANYPSSRAYEADYSTSGMTAGRICVPLTNANAYIALNSRV